VLEGVSGAGLDRLVVATDAQAIAEVVERLGFEVMLTDPHHPNGTARCAEVLHRLGDEAFEWVLNIQGDEPLIRPSVVNRLLEALRDSTADIVTLGAPIRQAEELFDPNVVKVVCDLSGRALYFSRSPVPCLRDASPSEWLEGHPFLKHIGLYAFRAEVLRGLPQLPPTPLEGAEQLEQLRWLEHGRSIRVVTGSFHLQGVDTEDDLLRVEKILLAEKSGKGEL